MGKLDIFTETTQQEILSELQLQNSLLTIMANGYELDSWKALEELAGSGKASRLLKTGYQLKDTWTDVVTGTTYETPWDIVDPDAKIITPQGEEKSAIIIAWHWATPFAVQFDKEEQIEATEETAIEGLTYYQRVTATNTWTRLDLQTGDPVPYADGVTIYHNEINDSSVNIIRYGYNRWSHSAYRQWLNSDKGKDEWWTAQHIGDKAPDQATQKAGFLTGVSADLLEVVHPIKITTALNTVCDKDIGATEDTYDRFWLPSIEQMYGVPQLAGVEGSYFPYWKEAMELDAPSNASIDARKIYAVENHTAAQNCRLRSAIRGDSYYVWYVSTAGQLLNFHSALSSYRCAPACAIYKP